MSKFLSAIFLSCCCFTLLLGAEEAWTSPNQAYLAEFPLTDVKYNLRLDGVTLDYKPLFDKAEAQEESGFIGYFGAGPQFRVYQDLIRMIFEEILGISIPPNFHFLGVPLYPRSLQELADVENAFLEDSSFLPSEIVKELFPFHISVYANHKTLGYCPAKDFSLGKKHFNLKVVYKDFYWLLNELGIDKGLLEQAFALIKVHLGEDSQVLLQLFDRSLETYAFIDQYCYAAYPSGYPYKNQAFSDFLQNPNKEFPPQFYLLLNDREVLNPAAPLLIKRYSKTQPSKIKAYEQDLRNLIRNTVYDSSGCEAYLDQLLLKWNEGW